MSPVLEEILIHGHIVAELDELTSPTSSSAPSPCEEPRAPRRPRRGHAWFVSLWFALRARLPAIPAFGAVLAALACGDSAKPVAPVDPVAMVAVAPADHRLVVGESVTLLAEPRSATGRPLEGRTVTWETSHPMVAMVSTGGRVAAIAAGAATIMATSEGVRGNAAMVVVARGPAPVDRVVVDPAVVVIGVGSTRQLTAVVRDQAGNVLTDRVVSWTTDHPSVAAVSATGLVTAARSGNATIVATSEGRAFAVSVTVTAPPAAVVRVDVTPSSGSIAVNEVVQFTAQPRGSGNEPLDRPVTWRSSDERIATVDATGRVTGRRQGIARITATSEGIARDLEVWVYAVNRYRLVRVGDGTLPRTLFTTTETGSDGTVRSVRWDAQEGHFRLGFDGRYEQAIVYWIHREGSPAVPATYVYRGSWAYEFTTAGGLVFYPLGTLPSFRGRVLADGSLELTRRLEPNTPELTFTHAAP